jgi:energy-coupling factor transporter ATP-binding protein EcfA2
MDPPTNQNEDVSDRPRAWIKTIAFNDGNHLTLEPHEVLVIVGPNNAGKSATLNEIFQRLQSNHAGNIVVNLTLTIRATRESVISWAEQNQNKVDLRSIDTPVGTMNKDSFIGQLEATERGGGLGLYVNLCVVHLSSEARLSAANSGFSTDFSRQIPTTPLQHLYESDDYEGRLSQIFRQAFGHDLIVNRSAGSQITLHMGKRPVPPAGKDRFAAEYRQAVHDLPLVHSQGDGIRAFLGILLMTLIVDRQMVLIDEPEAFLHPPQAVLLGRVL